MMDRRHLRVKQDFREFFQVPAMAHDGLLAAHSGRNRMTR